MQAPLLMGGAGTQVQSVAYADPIDPSWHILWRVDFVPAMGFATPLLAGGQRQHPLPKFGTTTPPPRQLIAGQSTGRSQRRSSR